MNYCVFEKPGCRCNQGHTVNGTNICHQETGRCYCENGWYGDKCFLGKSN